VAINYYRNDLYELGRTGGRLGCGTVVGIVVVAGVLVLGLASGRGWALVAGGLCAVLALLAVLQRLFDVSVFVVDPGPRTFVIRRYLWGRLDEELAFPLDQLERFELEKCADERWIASADGELTRIVARMSGGELVPLNAGFSHNRASAVDELNSRLRDVRSGMRS